MRENWNRSQPNTQLSAGTIEYLLAPVSPNCRVRDFIFAQGGLANTNIRVQLADGQNYLLRLYQREPKEAAKELALNKLLYGTIPVPKFHFFADSSDTSENTGTDTGTGVGPYAILDWVEGERLEVVAGSLTQESLCHLGEDLGRVLAKIHGFKFNKPGFFDSNLNISEADMGHAGLSEYASFCIDNPLTQERLGQELCQRVLSFWKNQGTILNEWNDTPCLTHADFNGSNILVKQVDNNWRVAAVLDWEFALSGVPFFDFGNLLRPPLGLVPGFDQSIADSYKAAGGSLPDNWRKISSVVDTINWLQFVTRPEAGANLIADARRMLENALETRPNQ